MKQNAADIKTIIFDLGGVLIDWNPKYVYRTLFKTETEVDWFLQNICTAAWNERQDEGYPLMAATAELVSTYPEWEKEIRAYYGRWREMLRGPIEESVRIFHELKKNPRLKFYALTNWSAELFPVALSQFDFLHWFDGRVVSGEEKTRKPFPEFYQILLDRFEIDPGLAVFIDDNPVNVTGGVNAGIPSIHFSSPEQLADTFRDLGLLKK